MRRFFVSCLILTMIAVTWGQPARATDSNGVEKLIEQTRSELQKKKKDEKKALTVLTKNQKVLNQIQSNLRRITDQLAAAQKRAASVKEQLKIAEDELISLEAKMNERRTLLRDRVNMLYRYGSASYLEYILSASSFGNLIERYELSSYYLKHDMDLVDNYRQAYNEIQKKRREIQARHEELNARARAITVLQADAKNEQQRAAVKVQLTQKQVAQIQADRVKLEQALEEYERLSKELGSEMRRKGSGDALGTGKMMWPVLGRLSSSFGWRRHPVLRRKKLHNGQDIAVPSGTPVLAADSGVVAIAGWRGGYGYLVAIDHGRGLSTFYGHNSVLLAREGEVVIKGQRIALSGSTGLSTGPHVHFEVRVNGEPVNPLPYLPKN